VWLRARYVSLTREGETFYADLVFRPDLAFYRVTVAEQGIILLISGPRGDASLPRREPESPERLKIRPPPQSENDHRQTGQEVRTRGSWPAAR